MSEVKVSDHETFEIALKRFNRKIQQDGFLLKHDAESTTKNRALSAKEKPLLCSVKQPVRVYKQAWHPL